MSFRNIYHKIFEYSTKNNVDYKIATDDVVSVFDIQYGKDKKK